jgi:hypothetical protein
MSMLYSEKMSEIELIVPARDILAVTRILGNQGIFQLNDGSYLNAESPGNPMIGRKGQVPLPEWNGESKF